MTDLAAIKDAIRAELRADGCSQADLARYLGASEKHVSRVLTSREDGSPAFVEAMAHAVGLSLRVGWGDSG